MKIEVILDIAYKKKNNGDYPARAMDFLDKNDLELGVEYDPIELIPSVSKLSNKDKITKALLLIAEEIQKSTVQVLEVIREKTYKQVAKMCHPDNGGSNKMFQVLQEMKEFFWDYKGEPRKEIKKLLWEVEKKMATTGLKGLF